MFFFGAAKMLAMYRLYGFSLSFGKLRPNLLDQRWNKGSCDLMLQESFSYSWRTMKLPPGVL